ncbi:hypothetical protein AABM34_20305 [Lysinibacillus fusiformis]
MRFSEKFKLDSNFQKDFDFLNIRVDFDNELFIDPTRIEAESDVFSEECDSIILSFFNKVFDLYETKNIKQARENLVNSGESNEIFLGYTKGFPEGTGNSEDGLNKIFNYIHSNGLLTNGVIGRIEDFQVFIDDFGCDKMSDLVASLIKRKLVEFTVSQCDKYGIKRDFKLERKYWNHIDEKWDNFVEFVPSVKGPGGLDYPVVLVPKKYTVSVYLYDEKKYWEKVISLRRQEVHKSEQTQLYLNKANNRGQLNKKDILEVELDGRTLKEYLVDETIRDLSTIQSFRESIRTTQRTKDFNNKLSDEEINEIIEISLGEYPSTDYTK